MYGLRHADSSDGKRSVCWYMCACTSARPRCHCTYCQAASKFELDFMIASEEPPSFAVCAPFGVQAGSGITPQSPEVFGASQLLRNVPIHDAIGRVATLPSLIAWYQGSVHSARSPRIPAFHIFPMNWSVLSACGFLARTNFAEAPTEPGPCCQSRSSKNRASFCAFDCSQIGIPRLFSLRP